MQLNPISWGLFNKMLIWLLVLKRHIEKEAMILYNVSRDYGKTQEAKKGEPD